MEITIVLKGATPAEVREALRELYLQGKPGKPMEAQPITIPDKVACNLTSSRRKTLGGTTWEESERTNAIRLKESGYSWKQIAITINKVYGNNRTPEAVREFFKRLRREG